MKDMRLEELLNKVKADAVEYYTYSKVTYDKESNTVHLTIADDQITNNVMRRISIPAVKEKWDNCYILLVKRLSALINTLFSINGYNIHSAIYLKFNNNIAELALSVYDGEIIYNKFN